MPDSTSESSFMRIAKKNVGKSVNLRFFRHVQMAITNGCGSRLVVYEKWQATRQFFLR
jgi:hypothetical protein